jgi:uncharacterized protein
MNEVRDGSAGLPPAWSKVRGDLPDVNIWLALVQPFHLHHELAKNYWQTTSAQFAQEASELTRDQIEPKIHFCRTTMLGMVRLLSQTSKLYGQAVSLKDSFAIYERYLHLPEVGFMTETAGTVDAMLSSMHNTWPQLHHRLSTDVYLAALAKIYRLRLVTFDRDFKRFELPDCLIIDTEKPA